MLKHFYLKKVPENLTLHFFTFQANHCNALIQLSKCAGKFNVQNGSVMSWDGPKGITEMKNELQYMYKGKM